jgi:hypothetical protein
LRALGPPASVIVLAVVAKLLLQQSSKVPDIFLTPQAVVIYKLPLASNVLILRHGAVSVTVPQNKVKQPEPLSYHNLQH